MSLILDALRKSEADRRRGQVPDLYAELPPATRRARALAQPWWWLAGALALLALLALALSQRPPAPMPAGTAPATSASDTPRNGNEDRVVQQPDNLAASTSDKPVDSVAGPSMSSPGTVVDLQDDIAIARPAQQRDPAPTPVEPDPRDASSAEAPPARSPPASASTPTPPVEPSLPPPPAASAPAAPVEASNPPIALSDLSVAERQQLPALKISMHLWDSSPAGRFAIIDGTRVAEGDRIGDALVESITRDGLVLAWNGRRLRLRIR